MAILSPTNRNVDILNQQVLDILEGESKTYKSFDSLMQTETSQTSDAHDYPVEFLNSLNPPGTHELKLKKGALIMLLWKFKYESWSL